MGRRSNVQSGDVIYNHTPYTLATADEDRNTPAATATATADADADAPLYQTMDRTRNHTRSSSGTSYHCIPFLPLFFIPPKMTHNLDLGCVFRPNIEGAKQKRLETRIK